MPSFIGYSEPGFAIIDSKRIAMADFGEGPRHSAEVNIRTYSIDDIVDLGSYNAEGECQHRFVNRPHSGPPKCRKCGLEYSPIWFRKRAKDLDSTDGAI